jgi:hypothetical protein
MDESHHWLVARESGNLIDLFNNYKYDGHPMLWVFCLWIIGKVTTNILFVKLFHAIIAIAIAFLFLFKSPFRKRYNILFIFSYFPLFEYGVLSRNYALTIFFLLLFCIYFKNDKKLLIPFILLGLAANSHLFGLIFSTILSSKIIYDKRLKLKEHLTPIVILLLMTAIAFITIKAPSDHYFYLETSNLFNLKELKSIITIWWKAIIPIPDLLTTNFWNTNFFTSNFKIGSIPFVLLSWGIPLLVLKRKSGYFLVFYFYAFAIMLFCLLTGLHISQRIGGFLLFALVISAWIEKNQFRGSDSIIKISFPLQKILLYCFFSIQIIAAATLLYTDFIRPFSNTKNIYNFLVENIEEGTPVYGGLFCNFIGINNYGDLNLKVISQEDKVKFCDWKVLTENKNKSSLDEGMTLMNSADYKEMIFLTPDKIINFDKLQYRIQLIGQSENAIVKNENAYIYLVSKR